MSTIILLNTYNTSDVFCYTIFIQTFDFINPFKEYLIGTFQVPTSVCWDLLSSEYRGSVWVYRRFGIDYQSSIQGSISSGMAWSLKMVMKNSYK